MRSPFVSIEELPSLDAVLLDARQKKEAYDAGHLPGAIHADLETQLSAARDEGADPARGGRHPLPPIERFAEQLGQWGITPSRNVVVYDDQGGANAAARLWWMLRSVGHENVFVLQQESHGTYTSAPPRITPAPPYPFTTWQWPTVDMAQVEELRNDPQWRVLDVRSRERYRGETEPIDPIAGHIPGAINLPFAENLEKGAFKSADALRAQYTELFGDVPPKRVVVHCGSGVTACHTLLALEAAGLHGASLYVGSWGEWCRNH
jgi:thiosulfate/3-mercaptopyruvate sulfurtransferase